MGELENTSVVEFDEGKTVVEDGQVVPGVMVKPETTSSKNGGG